MIPRPQAHLPAPGRRAAIAVVAGAVLAALAAGAGAQQGGEPLRLEEIPANFELWQDAEGFLWQLSRQGALGSAEASYFQAAMGLVVKGQPFAPTEGVRADGGQPGSEGARVALGQTLGAIAIRRDVWFDGERAGVRVLDVFENTGNRRESIRVELRTSFQNPWQDLHGTSGRILGTGPGGGLGERDFGVVVKFSPAEGRHDTLFVAGGERDAVRPAISYASNLREVTFGYDLDIEPGKRASLVHWIVQRNLQTPADAPEALRRFYQRRQLVDPRIPEDLVATVRNFDAPSFPAIGERPEDLEGLVSLNAVIEPLGVARRGDDLLWITPENQLSGTVHPEAVVTVETAWGERTSPVAAIAAIQGGGGVGRLPRVFLRDGRVWAGRVRAENLSMKTGEGLEVEELKPEEISLLLLRAAKTDGRPPEGAALLLELRSGDVLAVDRASADAAGLALLTPWGEVAAPLGTLRALVYASGSSAPRFRLWGEDGAMLTVFLGGEALSLREPGAGEDALEVPPAAIAGAWKAGEAPARSAMEVAEEWYELEDARLALGGRLPDRAVLLAGNNLLNGEVATETLHLVSGATVTPLRVAEIAAIRRSIDSDSDAAPLFEIELAGGEVLTGRLRESVVTIRAGGTEWRIPVSQWIAAQRPAPANPPGPKTDA